MTVNQQARFADVLPRYKGRLEVGELISLHHDRAAGMVPEQFLSRPNNTVCVRYGFPEIIRGGPTIWAQAGQTASSFSIRSVIFSASGSTAASKT